MRISVVVCTRNRSSSIRETLEAISKQHYPNFEMLVVDSSDDSDRKMTEELTLRFGGKYIHEPRRGLNVARNTGIAHASGSLVMFTDDDCLPEKDCLQQTAPNFSDPDVWACTARIIQHSHEGAADLFEEVAGQDLGKTRRRFSGTDIKFGIGFLLGNLTKVFSKHMKSRAPVPFGVGHGSGMTFRKEVFEKTGRFDERFGSGAKLGGCDDIDMLYRVLKADHAIVYEPSAIVRHKHRFALEEVFHTRYDYSRSGAIFMRQYRRDPLMFFMFYGRLTQLVLKTAQYKLLRRKELAQSFSSDLRGFLEGWGNHRKFIKDGGS